MADQKFAKVVRHFLRPNFEKIDSGLRPESIFSKFGLVFVASDKIWWLEFIGSVTGSGNAPQEADIGL